ncbi:MAG: hypothetical protein M1837_003767 [Sclerophora amabilis]|nr:MAG: hypothetical protein M1837_003767 [Sclerophora amabilis]
MLRVGASRITLTAEDLSDAAGRRERRRRDRDAHARATVPSQTEGNSTLSLPYYSTAEENTNDSSISEDLAPLRSRSYDTITPAGITSDTEDASEDSTPYTSSPPEQPCAEAETVRPASLVAEGQEGEDELWQGHGPGRSTEDTDVSEEHQGPPARKIDRATKDRASQIEGTSQASSSRDDFYWSSGEIDPLDVGGMATLGQRLADHLSLDGAGERSHLTRRSSSQLSASGLDAPSQDAPATSLPSLEPVEPRSQQRHSTRLPRSRLYLSEAAVSSSPERPTRTPSTNEEVQNSLVSTMAQPLGRIRPRTSPTTSGRAFSSILAERDRIELDSPEQEDEGSPSSDPIPSSPPELLRQSETSSTMNQGSSTRTWNSSSDTLPVLYVSRTNSDPLDQTPRDSSMADSIFERLDEAQRLSPSDSSPQSFFERHRQIFGSSSSQGTADDATQEPLRHSPTFSRPPPNTPHRSMRVYNDNLPPNTQPQTPRNRRSRLFNSSLTAPTAARPFSERLRRVRQRFSRSSTPDDPFQIRAEGEQENTVGLDGTRRRVVTRPLDGRTPWPSRFVEEFDEPQPPLPQTPPSQRRLRARLALHRR